MRVKQVSTCWTEALPLEDSLEVLRKLALRHCRLGGHYGREIGKLLANRNYRAVCEYKLDQTAVWDVLQLANCRQALALFAKLEDLDVGIDKKAVASAKFAETELRCKATNDFFLSFLAGRTTVRSSLVKQLYVARRKIREVLGRCPSISGMHLKVGPGATTAIRKAAANWQSKFASGLQCTENLYHSGYLPSLLRSLPLLCEAHREGWSIDDEGYLSEVLPVKLMWGELRFVPKNALTYRIAIIESFLNGMFQLGIGNAIAVRLRSVGVDIRDQSRNKTMAATASVLGNEATLDLESASDMKAFQLVKFLLPPDWFAVSNASRSSSILNNGMVVPMEKFSTMGNGLTFPLETLIFWALTAAVVPDAEMHRVAVYGDDIICPTEYCAGVVRLLELCGFVINKRKSYFSGPFRESCGGDYYSGTNVRPHYQKHLVSGESLFVLHNHYYRNLDFAACKAVLKHIPEDIRLFGPDGYGDGHLLGAEWPRFLSPKLKAKGFGGSFFETFLQKSRTQVSLYPGDFVSPSYSIYVKEGEDLIGSGLVKATTPVKFVRSGRPVWTLPGTEGYKKALVYTFTPC